MWVAGMPPLAKQENSGWRGCGGQRPVATLTVMDASDRGQVTTDLARPSSSLDLELEQSLQVLESQGLLRSLRRVDRRSGAIIQIGANSYVDFASNDYLGLASDARIASAAADALRTTGTGAAASRSISGNHAIHEELEKASRVIQGHRSCSQQVDALARHLIQILRDTSVV